MLLRLQVHGRQNFIEMSVTTKFLLVRHGQTEANLLGIAQGQTDTPLTEKGEKEAIDVANKLAACGGIDACYVSDLPRAVNTVNLIASQIPSLPMVVQRADIREINFGVYSGFMKETIRPIISHHKKNREIPYPQGESSFDFTARVEAFFDEVIRKDNCATVLVIAHYGVIETALKNFTDYKNNTPVSLCGADVVEIIFTEARNAQYRFF